MAIIYVPRVLGGTLILQSGTPTPPSGVTLVQAKARDGQVQAKARDGKVTARGH